MRAPNIHIHMVSAIAGVSLAMLFSTSAHAALVISTGTTQNVTCSAGLCSAASTDAVLNVSDLTMMLTAGNLTVQSGSVAQDISVDTPFSWTSANALTLDANRSLTVNKAVADSGPAALTLSTGKKGDLRFGPKGEISFIGTSNSLTINRRPYTLVDSIDSLAGAIAKLPSGYYALVHNYDAGADGVYAATPIPTAFAGALEGLGNTISNVHIFCKIGGPVGLFNDVTATGSIRDLRLGLLAVTSKARHARYQIVMGGLNAINEGLL